MLKHQSTDIILTATDGARRAARAPEGFNWRKYPERLIFEGRTWRYVACGAATPYYHEEEGPSGLSAD